MSWTPELDARLLELVAQFGENSWIDVASFIPGKINRQCFDRY